MKPVAETLRRYLVGAGFVLSLGGLVLVAIVQKILLDPTGEPTAIVWKTDILIVLVFCYSCAEMIRMLMKLRALIDPRLSATVQFLAILAIVCGVLPGEAPAQRKASQRRLVVNAPSVRTNGMYLITQHIWTPTGIVTIVTTNADPYFGTASQKQE